MSKAFFKSMNVTEIYVPFSIFKYQSFLHLNRHVKTECNNLKLDCCEYKRRLDTRKY